MSFWYLSCVVLQKIQMSAPIYPLGLSLLKPVVIVERLFLNSAVNDEWILDSYVTFYCYKCGKKYLLFFEILMIQGECFCMGEQNLYWHCEGYPDEFLEL